MYAISAIVIILICILIAPFKLRISYAEKVFNIQAYIFNVQFYNKKTNVSEKTEKIQEDTVKEQVDKLGSNIKMIKQKLCDFKELFRLSVRLMNKYVSIQKIKIKMLIGTADAATTAICAGGMWAVIYSLLGVLGSISYIKEHEVDISPSYQKMEISARGECIFTSRFVYIIVIAITVLIKIFSLRKDKEE